MALGHRHSNKGQQEHQNSASNGQNDGHHGDDVFNHVGGFGVVVVCVRSGHGLLSNEEDEKGFACILATEGKGLGTDLGTDGTKTWGHFSKKMTPPVNQGPGWGVIDPCK